MKKKFNFQINRLDKLKPWEVVPVFRRSFGSRRLAAGFAGRLARLYKAEVRLTEGADALQSSGAYFR